MSESLELKKAKDKFEMIGTKAVKLKDHPTNRRYVMIDIKSYFGTIPEVIVIEKVQGSNNTIIIKGIVPKKKKQKLPYEMAIPKRKDLEKAKTAKKPEK